MQLSIHSRRVVALVVFLACSVLALAQNPTDCSKLPDHSKLKAALTAAVKEGNGKNGGLGNQEWGTVVNRDGIICAVAFTGPNRGAEWPGSRLISAEKANTANAFSTDNFALSSGNVYTAAQPGNSLYSIVSGPNLNTAFAGDPQKFGQPDDPLMGKPIGGVIVFGGGLALYDKQGRIVGALGVSGDTACATTSSHGRRATASDLIMFPWESHRDQAITSFSTSSRAQAAAASVTRHAKAESPAKISSES
jgi:uncharacterized protein GlcG (DUF336 family)